MTPLVPAATLLAVAAVALVLGALLVPPVARRSARPPFIVGLCLATAAVVAAEAVSLVLSPAGSLATSLLGIQLVGSVAGIVIGAHVGVQILVGCGLWLLRPWARLAGMGYLGFLLASFLLWGLGDGHGREPGYVLAWQLCVLPFLTFSFMFLYGGGRYFIGRARAHPDSAS
ncbi:MAG: hypothetical protein V3R77_02680 [Candidatus Binatia bacterium]